MKRKENTISFFDAWKYKRKESIGLLALVALLSCVNGKAGAKIITALIKQIYKESKHARSLIKINEKYCRTVLHRLRADGLVEHIKRGSWNITEQGKKLVTFIQKKKEKPTMVSREESDTIVIFDVPESDRIKRAWLRFELAARGFSALQKSVWLGKGPLDADFIQFLKINNLLEMVHIFSIAKRGTI